MLVGALLVASAGAALADDDCHAVMERWQPREAVQKALQERGWQVGRIKIDDGCYEVRGTDGQGGGFKAKLDPATLEVVEMKRKDRHRERGERALARRIDRDRARIDALSAQLRALSPQGTLDRGYAIVLHADGRVVTDREEVEVGEILRVKVARGDFGVRPVTRRKARS